MITSGKTEQSRMNWTCSVVVHSTVNFLMMGRRKEGLVPDVVSPHVKDPLPGRGQVDTLSQDMG